MTKPLRCLLLLFLLDFGVAHAQVDPGNEALQRLVRSHDPSLFVATGALYLKQEAVRAAGGRALSPAQEAEVEAVIDTSIRDPSWFYAGLAAAVGSYLSAEEADEIATHFATDTGQQQRRVVELAVGEVLMNVYTFTNRIDYRVPGASREMEDLQRASGPMRGTCACPMFKDLEELQRTAGDRPIARDLSTDPEAVRFASSSAGVKYVKVLMIQGIESMTGHFEAVATQLRAMVAAQNARR
jgi:hypothetical protein